MWTTLCEYTYTVCWGPGTLSSVRSARGPGVVRAASGTALLIATEHAAIVVWRPGADFRLRLSYTSRLRCAERCNGSLLYTTNSADSIPPVHPSLSKPVTAPRLQGRLLCDRHVLSLPPTKEEVYVFARVRLSVCLLARLLKNACMDLDEMLRVDRCRD